MNVYNNSVENLRRNKFAMNVYNNSVENLWKKQEIYPQDFLPNKARYRSFSFLEGGFLGFLRHVYRFSTSLLRLPLALRGAQSRLTLLGAINF